MIKIDWWMGMMMDDTPKIFFFSADISKFILFSVRCSKKLCATSHLIL